MWTRIYVLSAAPDLMVRALRSWIRQADRHLDVRGGGQGLRVPQDALCVCDLTSPPAPLPPAGFKQSRPFPLVLAMGVDGIPPAWVDIVRLDHVVVVSVPAEDVGPFESIVAALEEQLFVDPEELFGHVIVNYPRLGAVSDIVRVMCANARSIRRPRHRLAAIGGVDVDVRRRVYAAGFVRVEHLMTYLRWCMCEVMTGKMGFGRARAHLLAGIRDTSNFRRQVRRARAESQWPPRQAP